MKQIYTAVITDQTEAEKIKAFAKKQGLTKSNLFRSALTDYFKKHGEDLELPILVRGNPNFQNKTKN